MMRNSLITIDENKFTLRVAVRILGRDSISGFESPPTVQIDGVEITLSVGWPYLILMADGFESEEEAESFLLRIKGGLWNVAIQRNFAFVPDFEKRTIKRSRCNDLAKAEADHGYVYEGGYSIFSSSDRVEVVSMSDASLNVGTNWESIKGVFVEGLTSARLPKNELAEDTETAIDLYCSTYQESSGRARFLTLMTCLEVLAPIPERNSAAVAALTEFGKQVSALIDDTNDKEARNALESLSQEINYKTKESIRRRLRHLVVSEAPVSETELAKLIEALESAYNVRNEAVHSGNLDSQKLAIVAQDTFEIVQLLLLARLGILNKTA